MHTLSAIYLEQMDINVWRQRQLLAGAPKRLDFSAYALENLTGEKVGVICLGSVCVPVGQELPLLRLLDAMLSAIQLKRTLISEKHIPANTQLILLMGELLAQTVLETQKPLDELRANNPYAYGGNAKLLATYHPLDLLLMPADKAKAWEDLKKVPLLLNH